MKQLGLLFCVAASLWARSAETVYFRAVMLPSNEVPAVAIDASGSATIRAHVVRDDAGQVTEGSVDFVVSYAFPGAVTITGLHIHNGPAGVNAGVTINTGLSAANSVDDSTGRGLIDRQAQVRSTDQAALASLKGMLENPAGYYVNLHTTVNPGGVIRGQLQRAESAVFIGLMSPANEVPPTGAAASAVSSVQVISARDSSGAFTSAQMIFDVNYRFGSQVTFTGFHIHGGPAGTNAAVIFNTGIGSGAASVTADASGSGNIRRPVEVNLASQVQRDALAGLLSNPQAYYINLHTTDFPGGVVRSQMRATDTMTFDVEMSPANEVPALTLDASAPAQITVHTVRAEDGGVLAGMVEFDVNPRFPGAVEMTGLHIHDGAAGVNGPVIINTGLSAANSVKSDTGFANIYRTVTVGDGAGLATLNSLVRNPENHYVNLHTTVNPGGVVRAQLAPAVTAVPTVTAVFAGNSDKTATTLAQGGLVSIWGTNLAKVTTNLDGWQGGVLPNYVNGVAVTVGGEFARLLYVSPNQITALVAFETPLGTQGISVNNGNGPSAPVNATVAAVAPALFFGPQGAMVLRESDLTGVDTASPARAGEVVLVYATGLGQTAPAAATGALGPATPSATAATVTATIGGRPADVVRAVSVPGYPGLYEVALRVPSGVAAGAAPIVLNAGQAASAPKSMVVAP